MTIQQYEELFDYAKSLENQITELKDKIEKLKIEQDCLEDIIYEFERIDEEETDDDTDSYCSDEPVSTLNDKEHETNVSVEVHMKDDKKSDIESTLVMITCSIVIFSFVNELVHKLQKGV